jgi:hypothetical protein
MIEKRKGAVRWSRKEAWGKDTGYVELLPHEKCLEVLPANRLELAGMQAKRWNEKKNEIDQLPKRDSNIRITAFWRAITCACQTRTMDITLIAKIHSARTMPVCVSVAGTLNTRRMSSITGNSSQGKRTIL